MTNYVSSMNIHIPPGTAIEELIGNYSKLLSAHLVAHDIVDMGVYANDNGMTHPVPEANARILEDFSATSNWLMYLKNKWSDVQISASAGGYSLTLIATCSNKSMEKLIEG